MCAKNSKLLIVLPLCSWTNSHQLWEAELQWNPYKGNVNWFEIGEFEKSGVKLQFLTGEGTSGGSKYWGFEKSGFHCIWYKSSRMRLVSTDHKSLNWTWANWESKLTCKVGAGCLAITDVSSLFFFCLVDASGLFFFCVLESFAFCFHFLAMLGGGRFSLSDLSLGTGINDCLRNSKSNL